MFDKADLKAAVEAGALTQDQAARFEGFLKTRSDPDRMLDPENLRFLTNFNDVFLTIGIGVLMTGLSFLSGIAFWNMLGPTKLTIVLTPVPVLVGAWLLAEYFCGRRRLLLPSMALSLIICAAAGALVAAILAPENERRLFDMRGVGYINQLYGTDQELKIAQRSHARFVNTTMMLTTLGAAVSDGLADGRVVFGSAL